MFRDKFFYFQNYVNFITWETTWNYLFFFYLSS